MTPSSGNKSYGIEDFRRYHAGEMSAQERHAIEKAAIDDPFLADALDGYEFTSTPSADLQAIQSRINARQSKKIVTLPVKKYGWLKAAAVIVLVAGGSWLALQLADNNKTDLAIEQPRPATQAAPVTVKEDTVITPVQPEENIENNTVVKRRAAVPVIKTPAPAPSEEAVKEEIVTGTETKEQVATTSAPERKYVPTGNRYNEAPRDYNNRNASPVPDNNVNARKADNIILNDARFENRSFENNAVVNNNRRAQSDTVKNLDVVLHPDNAGLSEVVVIAKEKKPAAKFKSRQIIVDTLEPAIGWAKFDEYITNNLHRPKDIEAKQPLSGEVELHFDVNSKGEPVNITVSRSLCQACDEEAIRLLREGPKWKKKKARKGKVSIKF